MLTIGFSTGALALGDFNRALSMLESSSVNAVELSALRWSELPELINALSSLDLSHYKYISFHAPSTDIPNERELIKSLNQVIDYYELNIVVHPDIIHEYSLWKQLGSYLCIENMDSRKSTGRTAKELGVIFGELPDARLCFDIAHARQVDSTMTEAYRILQEFGNRLEQVHISEVNSLGKHFVISLGAKLAYKPFADIIDKVPIIIESPVDKKNIESEIIKVKELLSITLGQKQL